MRPTASSRSSRRPAKLPIHLHTHNTAGTGAMTILKAIEAGCDIVDTALSPMAEGTSQPATESLCATLQGHRVRHRAWTWS